MVLAPSLLTGQPRRRLSLPLMPAGGSAEDQAPDSISQEADPSGLDGHDRRGHQPLYNLRRKPFAVGRVSDLEIKVRHCGSPLLCLAAATQAPNQPHPRRRCQRPGLRSWKQATRPSFDEPGQPIRGARGWANLSVSTLTYGNRFHHPFE